MLTDATADLAIALMLAATRRMSETEAIAARAADGTASAPTGWLGMGLQGKTLGIVGMGRIGQATARRAALGFGMRVVYFNRSPVGPFDFPAEALPTIEAVLAEADVVSLHVPGGGGNRGLISAERLAAMKPGAYLVNTARGDVVDEAALADGAGRAGGSPAPGSTSTPRSRRCPRRCWRLPNVTLLPHIGSATLETRTAMGMLAVDNLEALLRRRAAAVAGGLDVGASPRGPAMQLTVGGLSLDLRVPQRTSRRIKRSRDHSMNASALAALGAAAARAVLRIVDRRSCSSSTATPEAPRLPRRPVLTGVFSRRRRSRACSRRQRRSPGGRGRREASSQASGAGSRYLGADSAAAIAEGTAPTWAMAFATFGRARCDAGEASTRSGRAAVYTSTRGQTSATRRSPHSGSAPGDVSGARKVACPTGASQLLWADQPDAVASWACCDAAAATAGAAPGDDLAGRVPRSAGFARSQG